MFVGRVKLSGHDHDVNGDGILDTKFGSTKCSNSPIDEYGKIEAGREGSVTIDWQYSDDPVKIASSSINYHWNVAELNFLQEMYNVDDALEFTFNDKDMYKVAEGEFKLYFRVYSDSDKSGITIPVAENYKFSKPFAFTVNSEETVGDSLYVLDGDTVTVEYTDCTLPERNDGYASDQGDCAEIQAKTVVFTH